MSFKAIFRIDPIQKIIYKRYAALQINNIR